MDQLPSERIVISSPLSFSGSAQRIWRLTRLTENTYGRVALRVAAVLLIAVAWVAVAAWYVIWIGLFGIFFFAFRLLRRGSRRDKAEKQRHREVMEAMRR